MINYKHLHYFWKVARGGGVARASEQLNLTPQTISRQLSLLDEYFGVDVFTRIGRNLELTETGRLVLSYADEIFSLGSELEEVIHQLPDGRPQLFRVGVVDVLPKSIAHRILKPSLQMPEPGRMICREASLDTLLADLAVHRLDLGAGDGQQTEAQHHEGDHHLDQREAALAATTRGRTNGSRGRVLESSTHHWPVSEFQVWVRTPPRGFTTTA